jgi:hypothetical protein
VSLLWTAFWMTGEREVSACGRSEPHGEVNRRGRVGVRPMTRDCRSALLPVCAVPSSLQIFFRSLLMSVLERSVMVAAICCRLEAMVCNCGYLAEGGGGRVKATGLFVRGNASGD